MIGEESKHILITSLGINPQPTSYCLNGKTAKSDQSTVALLQLLPESDLPDEVIVLCTSKVLKDQYPKIKALIEKGEIRQRLSKPVEVSPLHVPDGKSEEEVWEILKRILGTIPQDEKCSLTLDLTHGFRSYPFLFFVAAIYLKALRNVDIRFVFYGMREAESEHKPIVDLSLILDMVEWFYATRTFRETGQAKNIIDLLKPFSVQPEGMKGEECKPYGMIKDLMTSFQTASAAYEQALPIELGIYAQKLTERLKNPLPDHLRKKMPLPEELFDQVKSFIAVYNLPIIKEKEKKKIKLDYEELTRQGKLIDTYLKQGYINNATALMREWIVNAVLFHKGLREGKERLEGMEWLAYNEKRKPVENMLWELKGSADKKSRNVSLSDGQKWLAEKWKFIGDKRNALAHSGFRPENAFVSEVGIEEINRFWLELKSSLKQPDKWNLDIPDKRNQNNFENEGTLLITSLGNSKGSLYSALTLIKPNCVFVVASERTKNNINEIIEKACWQGATEEYIMEDPFAGFRESKEAVDKAEHLISRAQKVIINLTGGTTVMQYVLQSCGNFAKKAGKKVELVALVDRRSIYEQQERPYEVGELITLENE